jgi:hypothetical protein
MRRFLLIAFASVLTVHSFAQDTASRKTLLKPGNAVPRSNDHFMLQVGYTMWQNKPDSINTGGLSRTFNAYFLFDFPFKTNPNWSVAIGPGIATDNVYLDKTYADLRGVTTAAVFRNQADTNHWRKFKVATAYLEAPVELRFSSNPDNNRSSFKVAVGAKIGTLISAGIKGKNMQTRDDKDISNYTLKEKSKTFFNRNRLSVTGRVGYGPFSLFASYGITPLFKEGLGPAVRPLTVGLTLSGL